MQSVTSTSASKHYTYMASGALAALFATVSFIWIILVSYRPTWVRHVECGECKPKCDAPADPQKAFVWALVITLVLAILVALLRKY